MERKRRKKVNGCLLRVLNLFLGDENGYLEIKERIIIGLFITTVVLLLLVTYIARQIRRMNEYAFDAGIEMSSIKYEKNMEENDEVETYILPKANEEAKEDRNKMNSVGDKNDEGVPGSPSTSN